MYSRNVTRPLVTALAFFLACYTLAQEQYSVRDHYNKLEYQIPMRDGVKLYTIIYAPKDTSRKYPFLMMRTPYSVAPYGPDSYRSSLGPSPEFMKSGYIFVYQDVRGRYMSEGDFKWMTPFIPNKRGNEVDESTDTFDTIEWLLKNIPNNNGRVGQWGISFPGFYTAAGMIDAHPALKASSPQAPMADNWLGDDMHHNGAFFLPHAMNFISGFGKPRTGPTQNYGPRVFQHGTPDGYRFFLEMGALRNANEKYNMNLIPIWQEWMTHGDYDEYWKARNVSQHMKNIKHGVLIVGGWFDAEDLYGPLAIYRAIEKYNPSNLTTIVMGPWYHGSWSGGDGDSLNDIHFEVKTGPHFRDNLQFPFFEHYLKDSAPLAIAEAVMFDTGSNRWLEVSQWPPKGLQEICLYLQKGERLSFSKPHKSGQPRFDEYVSDPRRPVPCSTEISPGMPRKYMIEDQRFAWQRPDVLSYESDVLSEDITLCGPIVASLYVSTTGSDADFIVKLIDVFPNDHPNNSPNGPNVRMGGYQMLVRGEPMRAKYRESWSKPKPLVPNQVTQVEFTLPDVLHTFKKGHRIMIQVQSSWFPLVDRNPQKFCDIYRAADSDFQKATHRVYLSGSASSHIRVGVLKQNQNQGFKTNNTMAN